MSYSPRTFLPRNTLALERREKRFRLFPRCECAAFYWTDEGQQKRLYASSYRNRMIRAFFRPLSNGPIEEFHSTHPQSAKHWNKKSATTEGVWPPRQESGHLSLSLYFLKQFHSNNSSPTRKWQLLAPHHVVGSFYLFHLPGHCEAACLPRPLTSDHLSEESHWCHKPQSIPIKSLTSTVLGEHLCVFLRSGVIEDQNY